MKIGLSKRGKLAGGLGLLLALVLVIALGVPAGADFFPSEYHQFLGSVKICDELVLTGDVTVNIEEDTTVVWTTTTPINASGNYGYTPDFLMIPVDDPETPGIKEGGEDGDTVRFYVQGRLAGTFIFEAGQGTVLDLQVTEVDLMVTSVGCCPIAVEYDEVSVTVGAGATQEFTDIPCGTEVLLTAEDSVSCVFDSWVVDDGDPVQDNPITVTMDDFHTATASCTVPVVGAPEVSTAVATDITTNSATLNGSLDSLGDYTSVDVSFEWGTTSKALDKETIPAETKTETGAFSAGISGLASDTTYYFRAKAVANGITVYGDELSFSTTGEDTTPPEVVSTSPVNDAGDIAIDTVVSATFSEDIQAGATFGDIDIGGATGVSASIDGDTLTIAHNDFAEDTIYEVTIPAGAVEDMTGNPLADDYTWSFTTGIPGTIDLVEGVNIIAYTGATAVLPGALTNIGPGELDVVDIIWARGAWTGGAWLKYNARFLVGTLSQLETGRGYIIVVTENCTWELPQ